jgi:hypothetical protein
LHHFQLGSLPEDCSEADNALVSRCAAVAELEVLLSAYRCGQATLWERWFELIEESPYIEGKPRRALIERGSSFFFAYADLLTAHAAGVYEQQIRQLRSGREPRRLRAVKSLLDGDPLAGSLLDFDLSRHHLGLVAWGEDPAAAARELARHLGRPLLYVRPLEHPDACWAWLSATRPLEPVCERNLRRFRSHSARLAIGLEAFGEEGFRVTHRQALRALRFAHDSAPPTHCYGDIVVESLAAENEEGARAFVAYELRGIEDDSATSRRLRETLVAYFHSECNAASASAKLGVHHQTVANRLRSVEDRLGGRSIAARRVEIEMALRLRDLLSVE